MKAVIQRVLKAKVEVEGKICGQIEKGLLIFLGVEKDDDKVDCEKLANKICRMRIFQDENDKTNLSLNDVQGQMLIVSQFTLLADCRKGNRPSFINAAQPDMAKQLYEHFTELCEEKISGKIQTGIFAADMKVSLENDGPFTILLDSNNLN